ncbi:MAG TPA: tetratricopeptide repeat protein [Terriglobia bacterium]|nr:tetratricopeptide repeat protein [Terriglobia bacterium]
MFLSPQLELLERPLPLRMGIGAAHDAVSTSSPQAQAFYDQGLAYLHSYEWIEAARSFNQALRLDPKLALAHVGLSYAHTELNVPAAAHSALERAVALNEHDRQHIAIRKAQMAAEDAPRDAAKLASYRKALDNALAQFPLDEELWLQRGVAESSDPADRGQGSPAGSARYYERALALAPSHFAAHHFLAHAFENSGRIDDALKHASAYAAMAPAIPHARHMNGHELRRLGQIDHAVAEFEAADRLETEYLKNEKIPFEHEWHYQHNLDLLGTSYQYLGQMAKAERLLKASFEIPSALAVQEFNKREWPVFLLSRGRTKEALEAAKVMIAHPSSLIRAAGHIEAGHAMLASSRFREAADEANAALKEMKSASDGAALVATSFEAVQGEFFLRTGQRGKGRTMLDQVIRKLRSAPGPDEWTQASFALEAIARAAREAGDWEYAARAANQMMEHDPAYAGTHYALALAAEHAGDGSTARAEFALAEKYWNKADPDLAELRDIRGRR